MKAKNCGSLRHPLKWNKFVFKGVSLTSVSVLINLPMSMKEHCKTIQN